MSVACLGSSKSTPLIRRAIVIASGPLRRMTARAPRPLGVDSATIVVIVKLIVGVALRGHPLPDPSIALCQSGGHGGPPLQLYLKDQHLFARWMCKGAC